MNLTRRETAQLTGVWLALAMLRWLAALPLNQPRIFRDELLHWQLARSFALGKAFLVSGQAADYPAVLYPSLLGPAFLAPNPHAAFHVAQLLNALMFSAVALSAYALARELGGHRAALAVGALAALVPAGAYSALIMEENLYYPLFVLSCWLGLRVLARGEMRDAAACAVALVLTYFAKPLAVPLVAAYAGVVVLWALVAWRAPSREEGPSLAGLAIRAAPVVAFGAMLLVRHALSTRGAPAAEQGSVVLGRFYAEEMGGPLLPPLVPLVKVVLSLVLALALGAGVAPAVAMLGGWRERLADRRRLWLTVLALAIAAVYALAAARHTLLLNQMPKIHERYVFAVAPLFIALFLTADARPLRHATTIAVGCALLAAMLAILDRFALRDNAWITAPSLTLPWLLRDRVGSGVVLALLVGAGAAVVCRGARREGGRRPTLRRAAWIAAPLLVLNVGWYLFVYHIQAMLQPIVRTVDALERRTPSGALVTLVAREDAPPMQMLAWYAKFWLQERATIYWAGAGAPPSYADTSGPAKNVVHATMPAYLVGVRGIESLCPGAAPEPSLAPDPALGVEVLSVPRSGCRATSSPSPRAP
jgi:hypothetical protein